MFPGEQWLAAVVVLVTVGVAAAFGWRQWRQFRRTAEAGDGSEERQFLHRTAKRRLILSGLLAAVGILIAATFLSGLDSAALAIGVARQAAPPGEPLALTGADKNTVLLLGGLWIIILLLLLAIVIGVGFDLWHVRRHWRQSLNRLRDDRAAMLNRQLNRLRNEHRESQINPEWN